MNWFTSTTTRFVICPLPVPLNLNNSCTFLTSPRLRLSVSHALLFCSETDKRSFFICISVFGLFRESNSQNFQESFRMRPPVTHFFVLIVSHSGARISCNNPTAPTFVTLSNSSSCDCNWQSFFSTRGPMCQMSLSWEDKENKWKATYWQMNKKWK